MFASSEQISMLLNFLSEHSELARGHQRCVGERVRAKQLWRQITTDLNSLGGCTKTVKQWQKVWADRKHRAKKAVAAAQFANAPKYTKINAQIIQILGEGFWEPQTDYRVPTLPQDPSQQMHFIDMPSSYENLFDWEADPLSSSSFSQPVAVTQATASHPEHFGRVRKGSPQVAEHSVPSRYSNMEGQRVSAKAVRNEQLPLIRESLAELCKIASEYLQVYRERND